MGFMASLLPHGPQATSMPPVPADRTVPTVQCYYSYLLTGVYRHTYSLHVDRHSCMSYFRSAIPHSRAPRVDPRIVRQYAVWFYCLSANTIVLVMIGLAAVFCFHSSEYMVMCTFVRSEEYAIPCVLQREHGLRMVQTLNGER